MRYVKLESAKKSRSSQMLAIRSGIKVGIIRKRGFIIYFNRGEDTGSEHDDWLMAENEMELSENNVNYN